MSIELRIPEVGESVTEAQIARWLKAEGEHVNKDEPVVELETDKATLELPSPAAGTLKGPLKKTGDTAAIGDVIGHIEEGAGALPGTGAPSASGPQKTPGHDGSAAPSAVQKSPPVPVRERPERAKAAASRRQPMSAPREPIAPSPAPTFRETAPSMESEGAQELPEFPNPPSLLNPKSDSGAPVQIPTPSDGREEELVPMSPMRRRIAQRLVQAQQTAALLTTFNEVDMSVVTAFRRQFQEAFQAKYKIKLGLMSFFVKATIDALKQFPALNARINGTDIIYRNYYDIGIAISTDRGLVVPILRDAQRMSFAEIELAIADFATRARDNHIRVDELQGGTFTITNGGVFGSLLSTPIINPPQSGVLGMHTIQDRPVARNGNVVVRPMMYLALTYDHRLVDGREAIQCLKHIMSGIEEPARMLIEV